MKIKVNKDITDLFKPKEVNDFYFFLVGGYVRDALLNKESYDLDVATNLPIESLVEMFKDYAINKDAIQYGAISFQFKDYAVQITVLRKDSKETNGRYPDKIIYTDKLDEDVLRRDFTINALYADLNGNVIDLVHGLNDLNQHVIKTVIDPKISFNQDYLRMLRCIRFANRFNYSIEDNTYKALMENLEKIKNLSNYRIYQEIKEFSLKQGMQQYLNLYAQVVSTYCGMGIQFKELSFIPCSEYFFYSFQFNQQSNDYVKFVLNKLGYPAKFANLVNKLKPFILLDKNVDIVFKKSLASKEFEIDILKDLSAYYGIDLVDEIDHLQKMDIVLHQKQIKCTTTDFKKINLKPHEFKDAYQFLLIALYKNEVKNNKDALLEYIKQNRLQFNKYKNLCSSS